MEKLIELTGQSEMPMDVWIDDDQRVRRIEMEQVIHQGQVKMRAQLTVEYVRFGVPVEVDVPRRRRGVRRDQELGIEPLDQDLG